MDPEDFNGMRFEGSVDGKDWELITERDDFHSLAQYHLKKDEHFSPNATLTYKALRFVHDSTSKCSVDRIEWQGSLVSLTNVSTFDVVISDGATEINFTDAVTYLEERTPIINDIEPNSGDYFGGYDITLTGENLGFA